MKGGVTCLGGMFCRRNKVKSAIIEEAVVAKKEIHDSTVTDATYRENSVSFSGKETTVILHDLYALRKPTGNVDSSREVHLRVEPEGFVSSSSSSSSSDVVPATDVTELQHGPNNVATDVDSPSCILSTGFSSLKTDADSSNRSMTRSSSVKGVVVADAEYEGEDEEDERGAERPDGENVLLFDDGRSEPARIEDYSSPQPKVMDKDSARYYHEFSAAAGYGPVSRNDNCFQDLEMVSGHVSDPGVYPKGLESACRSPLINGCEALEDKTHERLAARDRSEFDLGVRNQDNSSVVSGPQPTLLSYESGSSTTGEVRDGVAFIGLGGSPKSEAAYNQYNVDHAMFKYGASSEVLEAHKRKPWWKVFLVSHRNIHLEVARAGVALGTLAEGETARSLTPVNGYVSDVEDRSGRSSPSTTQNEGVSDGRKLEKAGSLLRISLSEQDLHRQALGESQAQELSCAEMIVADPAWNGQVVLSDSNQPSITARRWDTFTERTGLSRVEEWVSNVPLAPALDEDQFEPQPEIGPDSPTAPAAAFFSQFGEDSPFNDQEEKHGAVRAEGVLDADTEMARMVARSVNPLSTVAHFSGVGLKVLPSLAVFTSLKTLNLSANNIVRITPGCLPKSLHTLDLSRNQIVMIEGLRELTRLRALNLSFNRITRIGNGLSSCMSLKELYLAGNKISEVEGLHRLSKLCVLDLSFNKLTTTKSLGQIAANYKSLQALNLLGNAVQSNLGDDHMRRFVTGVCPQVLYLNKQPLKTVSNRDAVDNNVARAALGKSNGGKAATKPSKRASAGHSSTSNHRRSHSGGGGGSSKTKSASKGVVSPDFSAYHRKSHHSSNRPQDKASTSKESRKGGVLPAEYSTIQRVRSDDTLVREHSNSILPSHLSGELVEAH